MSQSQPVTAEVSANVTLGFDVNESTSSATSSPSPDVPKVIALTVTLIGIVVVALVGYFIWRQFFKSVRPRHGIEKHEQNGHLEENQKKVNYYDQFKVDDHQLTVNSVTAIRWDEDEQKNGINKHRCEINKDEEPTPQHREIKTGKRIFSVDKVPEKLKTVPAHYGPKIIKVPKDVAKSLTCSDSNQYTLAIIDKNSKTIHNIDMREYRLMKGGVRVKTGSTGRLHPSHRDPKPLNQRPSDNYTHDEPDRSIDDAELRCSTDESYTTNSSKFETDELSSNEKIPLCNGNGVNMDAVITTQLDECELTDKLLG